MKQDTSDGEYYKPFIGKHFMLGFSNSLPSGFIKLTANTGLKIKATINEAASVRIKMVGEIDHELTDESFPKQ